MKERLDVMMVNRGLAESREKAKAIIMSGIVYVDNIKEDKAGSTFDEKAQIEVRGNTLKYVSRGGLKLEKAMDCFGVSLAGKVAMDVGSSTGGFTDCMMQIQSCLRYHPVSHNGYLFSPYRQPAHRFEASMQAVRVRHPPNIP